MLFIFLNRSVNFLLDFSCTAVQISLTYSVTRNTIHCRWQTRQMAGVELAPARTTVPSVDAADVRWRTQPSTRSAASATSASIQPSTASFRSWFDKECECETPDPTARAAFAAAAVEQLLRPHPLLPPRVLMSPRPSPSINSAMLDVTFDREDRSINQQYTNDQLLLKLFNYERCIHLPVCTEIITNLSSQRFWLGVVISDGQLTKINKLNYN